MLRYFWPLYTNQTLKHNNYTTTAFLSPGIKPGVPRNITVTELSNGFLITWMAPTERADLIQHYVIRYRTDGPWKPLSKTLIRPEDTQFLGKLDSFNFYNRLLIMFTMRSVLPRSWNNTKICCSTKIGLGESMS